MAVTYKSSAANADPTVNSGLVTIPTIASGDLLIAFALGNAITGTIPDPGNSAPSGWTQYGSTAIFYKISNGTEGGTVPDFGGSPQKFTAVVVVTAGTFDTVNPIGALVENTEAQGDVTKTSGSVAPITINTLAIIFIGETDNTTMSGYTGGGISWTEVIDVNNVNNEDTALHVAHGQNPANSSMSVVSTSSQNTGGTRSVLLFVKERQDFTISETATLTEIITNPVNLNVTITESVSLTETKSLNGGWVNEDKPSTASWVNEDKP